MGTFVVDGDTEAARGCDRQRLIAVLGAIDEILYKRAGARSDWELDRVRCTHLQSQTVAVFFSMLAVLATAVGAIAVPIEDWRASTDTVRVQPAAADGPPGVSGPVIHVSGPSGNAWNYVSAPAQAIRPGQRYRLSLWLRIDRTGTATPAPYLKCEFVDVARQSLGRANSDPYDLSAPGTWQKLSVEFNGPAHATSCYAALEKGVQAPTEIDAYLTGAVLEESNEPARASAAAPRLQPTSALAARPPRLFLDARGFEDLRARIQTTHAGLWRDLLRQANALAAAPPPVYQPPTTRDDEQLWQRDVGNAMPTLALAHRLSGDSKYLDAARAYASTAASYPTWGAGRNASVSLASSHLLVGLSVVYDWLHADLDDATKAALRSAIARHAAATYEYERSGQGGRRLLANSSWVRVSALGTAGFALAGEDPAAPQWTDHATRTFRRALASLGPDGASFEGVGYWGYAIEYLLKYLDLASSLAGQDLYDSAWLRETAKYRLYLSLPLNAWSKTSSVVDLSDSPRNNWYGPDYSLRGLASKFRDGHAQWLADAIDARDLAATESIWLNLVWFDPRLEPVAPTSLPTLHHFADMGIVSARSDWSGDESLLVFKSGPFAGHHVLTALAFDPGAYHVHPDANHFVLFGGGEWLIRDDGYGAKSTAQHNTLLVGGRGQLGEGAGSFDAAAALAARASPRITAVRSAPDLDRISADAASAYPTSLGVEKAERHLLFLKPDVLIVLDDVATSKAQPLELRFHPEQPATRLPGDVFHAKGPKTTLRIEPLTRYGVVASYDETPALDARQGADGMLRTLRLGQAGPSWRNAVAFSWGESPAAVSLTRVADRWRFETGNRVVEFDWGTSEACSYDKRETSTCKPPAGDLREAE